MSRPTSLPPRCPLLSRGVPRRAMDSRSHTTQKDDNLCAQEPIFPSHESPFDEQPIWLNDLLAGQETITRGGMSSLRRSSSDPAGLLDVAKNFHGSIYPVIEEDALSDGFLHDSLESEGSCEVGCGFEAGNCVYGPNSPRQKGKLTDSESSMIASLLENAPSDPLKYLNVDSSSTAVLNESHGKGDYTPPMNPEAEKITRRHSGQRSRVRKLQYIAELERNIDLLQTLGADFASRVASLFQYRLDLSVENKKLRQQIASLRQEKLIKEGLHQSLKNEAGRLRMTCGRHRRAASCFEVPSAVDSASVNWQMLDFGKMSLGGSQSSLKHSFG